LHLAVLDVGQGDALVVRSPHGRSFVVDAGGSPRGRFDLGERVGGPFLWTTGVRRIDTLVVTHAHPDHAGGVPFLLRAFGVGEVWEGPAPLTDKAYAILDEALARARVGRRTVVRGAVADWDGVSVEVLGPRPRRPPRSVRNDDSVVLALRFGEVRFLLTGDIEAVAEAELLRETGMVLAAAVLKVPHHGSRSSSSTGFVGAVGPVLAVASAGARNPFGHPHPDVLRRYREAGALVLRTDREGTTFVSTDGRRVWIRNPGEALETRVR
jgi:competence protein ComEC